MEFDELSKKRITKTIEDYCEKRIPAHLRNQLKVNYTIRGNSVTLFESRPFYKDSKKWIDVPIAQLRFEQKSSLWTLYWQRSNGRWLLYDDVQPSKDINELITEIYKDPYGAFGG